MQNSKKVVLNTAILYVRMILTMGISFFSTRLVLTALGASDYGIFNLIAGVIAMLSFLNTAMATSTQRFLSFYQGKKDLGMQKKVFTNSLLLHLCIGVVIVICLEIVGLGLFDGFLNIPVNRVDIAKDIYHFMSLTVFFTIVGVPFTGSLIAHENMLWVALVNFIETLMKLGIALLLYIIPIDKLFIYGILTACVSVVSLFLYSTFCFARYEDCTVKGISTVDGKIIKQLSSFAGWNLFGTACSIGRTQGFALLFNLFLGAVVNAAYGLANQVASQINFFSATMLRALNPQIMKSEGAGDRLRASRLSMIASKFGFFLLAIFAIPSMFEMEAILRFWLNEVPPHAVEFCTLLIFGLLINQLTIGVQSALQAAGKLKMYQTVVGAVILLNLPVAYLLLKYDFPPSFVLISYIFIEILACCLRLSIARTEINYNISNYFRRVLLKELIPVLTAGVACFIIVYWLDCPFRFLITGIISGIAFSVSIYFYGLCQDERIIINRLLIQVQGKMKITDRG